MMDGESVMMGCGLMKLQAEGWARFPASHKLRGPFFLMGSTHSLILCTPNACRSASSREANCYTEFGIINGAFRTQPCSIVAHRKRFSPLLTSGAASSTLSGSIFSATVSFHHFAGFRSSQSGDLQDNMNEHNVSCNMGPHGPLNNLQQDASNGIDEAIQKKEDCLKDDYKTQKIADSFASSVALSHPVQEHLVGKENFGKDDRETVSTLGELTNSAYSVKMVQTHVEEHLVQEENWLEDECETHEVTEVSASAELNNSAYLSQAVKTHIEEHLVEKENCLQDVCGTHKVMEASASVDSTNSAHLIEVSKKKNHLNNDCKIRKVTEASGESANSAYSVKMIKMNEKEHLETKGNRLKDGRKISAPLKEEVLVQSRKHMTIIAFDLETTGLKASEDKIIEFAARDLAGGEFSTIQALINPERSVPSNVSAIHGIYTEMVNKPSIPVWKEFAPILIKYVESRRVGTGPVLLVAHNGKRFDVPFLVREFQSCSLQIPSWWQFVDSLQLAGEVMKKHGLKRPKNLSDLYEAYGLPYVGEAHRALVDTHKLALLLQRLMLDLRWPPSKLLKVAFTAKDIKI